MLDLLKIQEEIREFWERNNIPKKIVEKRFSEKKPKFFLLDGPPYVNQVAHVGHIKTTTMKDVWSKFKLMQGFASWFQPGFDCHGLPIENMVERKLGIKSKKEIEEKIGVERFMKLCREHAKGNEQVWLELYRKLGAWRGYFQPYLTLENYYIEAGWWTIKKFFEKGMIYQGEKPVFWCCRCQTSLAGYEVTDSYAQVKDPAIYVKFRIKGNEFIVIYTTTPWTLIGNVAIAVHPEEKYVKVKVGNEILIVAKKRVKAIFEELLNVEYQVIEEFPGKKLEGTKYEPVVNVPIQQELSKKENAHKVILSIPVLKSKAYAKKVERISEMEEEVSHLVNVEEGTGCVHIAPGHGPEDYYIGQYYNLPAVSPVDDEGKFTEDAGEFRGIFVKDANNLIIQKLKEKNLLLYEGSVVHSYPLCWRCKSPLIFRLSKQWFLSIEPIKEKMLEENKKVRWLPDYGKKRFENWARQATDWCISRQRYWGIPLPIWICKRCGNLEVIGSKKELEEKSVNIKEIQDLHKHFVDKVKIKCKKCGELMERVPDVLDVWFDSGIAPWASLGYPFRNKEMFEKLWPVDLVCESQDQIRGWFYSLMFCGVGIFNRSPYKTVCMMGWVVDEKGEKMSKSLGNVVWAEDALNKYGADLLRFYYCFAKPPWEIQPFSFKALEDTKKYFNTLWNCFQFFLTYCNKLDFSLENLKLEDRWILSKLNSLIKEFTEYMESFKFNLAMKAWAEFLLEDLSRTYIKLIRDRVWVSRKGKKKQSALSTLYFSLLTLIKLLAPISPFISEYLYQRLKKFKKEKKTSIFEEEFPSVQTSFLDEELEKDFEIAKKIIEACYKARQEAKIKLRWPIKRLVLILKEGKDSAKRLKEIIKRMCNCKRICFTKRRGKFVRVDFELGSVLIDSELDRKLIKEAIRRELIRAIQFERKKEGLRVKDKIKVEVKASDLAKEALKEKIEDVKRKICAVELEFKEEVEERYRLKLFDQTISFNFKKVE